MLYCVNQQRPIKTTDFDHVEEYKAKKWSEYDVQVKKGNAQEEHKMDDEEDDKDY